MPETSVFVLTGENDYALLEEKRRWIDHFNEKHGPENCIRLEGRNATMRQLLDEVGVAPFIASKRLVVVESIPKLTKEDVATLLASIHPDVIVVFVDPKPDQRLGGVKELLKTTDVRQFPPLKGKQLREWVARETKRKGLSMENDALELLLELIDEDQGMLWTEIEKLSLYAAGKRVTREDIETMVPPSGESRAYLSDLLARSGGKKTAFAVKRMIDRGQQDAFAVWNLLLWTVRNLVAVWAAKHDGMSPNDIAKHAGMSPFAVRSLLQIADRLDESSVRAIVEEAALADTRLKTGDYRATTEDARELEAAIDRLLLKVR